ncbi:MAG: PQQ-binding-like beta-propeller repeat protein [Verrucomicrobiales bacterium]|nr:PQQ-binding-like beta-propeller repeat protein [Verrucomicrobiales bacterium]
MIWRIASLSIALGLTALADDWPHFLGPKTDSHSAETGLDLDFTEEDLEPAWTYERGKGHTGPVIAGEYLVFIHQLDEKEEIVCLNPDTGEARWKHSYATVVNQNFGIFDEPFGPPVIDPETGTVFTHGNDGDLKALKLEDGEVIWEKNLDKDYGVPPTFFGRGSGPLVHGDLLIVHNGTNDACVVAFDKKTGAEKWKSPHAWNGSYASPVIGKVNGEDRIFVFAGGKTRPPHGGLLCVDPKDGKINDAYTWRTSNPTSVNAASPVPCGENRVFISEDYGLGGVMIQYDENFKARTAWKAGDFGCQFQTPIYHDGVIYGFGGTGGLMVAYDVTYGNLLWSETFLRLTIQHNDRKLPVNLGRASMIYVQDSFICLGESGTLLRLDLSAHSRPSVLSKAQPFYAPESWAPPAIANGRLYLMQNEMGRKLICYDLRKK